MKSILSICFLVVSTVLHAQHEEFGWLIGTWQEENKMAFEVWKDEGSFLSGNSYQMDQSGNKAVTEEIKLMKKGNDFYYIPDVAGPQGPIEFKIIVFDKNGFTAENPSHDFPKRIVYKKMGKQLEATISGGDKSVRYVFRKTK